ncbi:uncharacterized protein LOC111921920 [Lactuca sativa]|uniref:uncharacterized protein LOC111921920 n=1 Tax=Lactuca sativa TaxID=4236 RepID=UPI000CD92167|nr:uncharacterized protein LOC111921920 [Lactuca sativa]
MHCNNYNKKGHIARYCRDSAEQANPAANVGASRACYCCGETGHCKWDCPKAKNTNTGGVGRILALGQGEAREDAVVVTGTLLLDNSYACILFDSGVKRSFASHKFKKLLRKNPQSLKDTYIVEMTNGNTESTNDIYSGCTLTLHNHSFKIDLLPVSIKRFDIIIGMDWLCSNRADILCYKRVVHLNLSSGETLVVYGNKPSVKLQISSCVKTQQYLRKEYHAFLAHVVDKKHEVKNIKDITEVCNFSDVFP